MAKLITICSLLLVTLAVARADNPYASIAQRNVFGLVPISSVDTNEVATPPSSTILLNGITCIFKIPQALCQITTATNKVSCIFDLGETKDGITCVAIDYTNGIVTFANHGVEQQIGFTNTKTKEPVAAAEPDPAIPSNLVQGVAVMPTVMPPTPTPEQVIISNAGRTPQAMEEARKLLEQYNLKPPTGE